MVWAILHVAVPAKGLQAAAVFLVLGTARTLRNVGQGAGLQLFDNLPGAAGSGPDGPGAGGAAQGAVALAVALVVIQGYGGDVLPFDVFPDVQLGPVQQGMDAHMGTRRKVGLELVPELRGLVVQVPVVVLVPGGEVALFGAGALFVRAGAHDDPGVSGLVGVLLVFPGAQVQPVAGPLSVQGIGQGFGLQQAAAFHPAHCPVREGRPGVKRFPVLSIDHIQPVLPGQPVPVFDHFRDFIVGVDVHQRKRNVPEKGLAGQPQKHGGILADGPEHAHVVKGGVGLPQDVYAFVFQCVEMIQCIVPPRYT